jgi:hypothetical protein
MRVYAWYDIDKYPVSGLRLSMDWVTPTVSVTGASAAAASAFLDPTGKQTKAPLATKTHTRKAVNLPLPIIKIPPIVLVPLAFP